MSGEKPTPRAFSGLEYGMIMGMAVAASGELFDLIAIAILYFVLKRAKPKADFEVLMVSSIYLGAAIVEFIQMDLRPQHYSAKYLWMPVYVTVVSLALFYWEKRIWAWLLLVYSGIFGILYLLGAAIKSSKNAPAQSSFFYALVSFMIFWLIIRWLRKKAPPPPASGAPDQPQAPLEQ